MRHTFYGPPFAGQLRKKKFLLAFGAILVAMAISADSASAWITAGAGNIYDTTGSVNIYNDCSVNAGGGIYAQDGDVVTTQKWNQMVCRIGQLYAYMQDTVRGATEAFDFRQSIVGGAKGFFLQNIGLGYDTANDSWGIPGVWWFDATKAYGPAWVERKANISYRPSTQTLELAGFDGGVVIWEYADDFGDDAVDRVGQWKIGWVKINIYDTAAFDTTCQYRVSTSDGYVINMPAVGAGELRGMLDNSATAAMGPPARVQVTSDAKTHWRNPDILWSSADTSAYGTYVTKIEKLCLPGYDS